MVAFLLLFVALSRTYREMFRRPESRALLVLSTTLVILGAVFYHSLEHWSWLDSFYFCVVTLGTVGYGDLTPGTPWGKLFTMVYIIVGLSIIGGFFATAGQLIRPTPFLKKEESQIEAGLQVPNEKDEASPGNRPVN